MVLIKSKDDESQQPLVRLDDGAAGPSDAQAPPPSFEESAGHVLIDFDQGGALVPAGGEAPPPRFEPYNAEHWVSKDKSIISHDPHLNQDGEALYRFLLSQSDTPPTYGVHIKGTHVEQRTRIVHKNNNGRRSTETERYNETVTDFDFAIDLSQHVRPQATQWTVGDDEPVYRGLMKREVGQPDDTRKAVKAEVKSFKQWLQERKSAGLPPWVGTSYAPEQGGPVPLQQKHAVLKSSWTLRQWADDYCASPKVFKEFVYEKVVYGWYILGLEGAIQSAIRSTHYTGDIDIKFDTSIAKVIIRPDTRLSRALSNHWLKLLLIVTLIYPFIWLFQHFHSRGGGRWTVAGGAYALKRWEVVDAGETNGEIIQTEAGPRRLVGMKEGHWFKAWEATIRRMVAAKRVDPTPMYAPDNITNHYASATLDGYEG